ncbi:Frataxin [Hypoxylon sp. NC1633]|nr:Frataxin [Hypoxylon sp. NC1633]
MSRANLTKLGRLTTRRLASAAPLVATRDMRRPIVSLHTETTPRQSITCRLFSNSLRVAKPSSQNTTAAPITSEEYHELADEYLDNILSKYENLQDEKGEVDVEFSSGVMSVKVPNVGTYVINKQPPNKQIWLSSPISGPKRFDYVVIGDGAGDKQDTGKGDWVYMRDGTTLNSILREETGIEV